jgi:hypothetical protein
MKSPRLRLAVTAALFLSWIGWLVYLATTTTHPEVLSRPQFLLSKLDVVVEVTAAEGAPNGQVRVVKVLWSEDEADAGLADKMLTVENLPDIAKKEDGWQGPGRYLIPLEKPKGPEGTRYQVPPIPRSPGFPPVDKSGVRPREGRPRIYPHSREVEIQQQQIRAGNWEGDKD